MRKMKASLQEEAKCIQCMICFIIITTIISTCIFTNITTDCEKKPAVVNLNSDRRQSQRKIYDLVLI